MNRQTILNLDGKPFASTETAEQMRDMLNRESDHFQAGYRYQVDETVDEHNVAKYLVVRADDTEQQI
ncbi:MAG: hypothetical protein CVV06_01875 [Gammaproteobacteria bacterium HGW-Gammaproteobacteria-10]|nr:MAG: hypothetical protein CVV06_01875 [Gammaproteobacteria bacterium HGW-Gammaproteobacteria-10]